MSDGIPLPWPAPRPRDDDADGERPAPAAAPHYEIQRVNSDDTTGPVEVLPITRPPWAAATGRRGFLGAGIASSIAATLLVSGCQPDSSAPPPSPSPYTPPPYTPPPYTPPPYTPPATTEPSTTEYTPPPETTTTTPPYTYSPPPTYSPGGGGGGGGTYCRCNKICTCIPVCQAHRLADPDPTVRRMAEVVVLAMGRRELPYLRWAAATAPEPQRAGIAERIAEVDSGRTLRPDDLDTAELAGADYAGYLASDDAVTSVLAAQVLVLRATHVGSGLSGTLARDAARSLDLGRALHRARSPEWGHVHA